MFLTAIRVFGEMFSPVRDRGDNFITYYPFANSRAGNVLEYYSNKPDGTKVNVKVMFICQSTSELMYFFMFNFSVVFSCSAM